MGRITRGAGSLLMILMLFLGCSSANTPATIPSKALQPSNSEGAQRWTWGQWMFYISELHDSIEAVPIRETDWHVNILKFLEGPPCSNCLKIGAPIIQPDKTVKLKVMLTHPFPTQPQYTGFDVQGVVIFPSTRQWAHSLDTFTGYMNCLWYDQDSAPLRFSWWGDGGPALINADGYSFYFWPGYDLGEGYSLPIFHYQDGKRASDQSLIDSTVNPFIFFNDGSERRMFKTTDTIQRTYHLKLPPGPVAFGYIVIASWAPPTKTPVTNPAVDFPDYANSEEPLEITFNQFAPVDPNGPNGAGVCGDGEENLFADGTIKTYPHMRCDYVMLYGPDVTNGLGLDPDNTCSGLIGDEIHNPFPMEEYQLFCVLPKIVDPNPYINGTYPALLMVRYGLEPPVDFDKLQYYTVVSGWQCKIVDVDFQASG